MYIYIAITNEQISAVKMSSKVLLVHSEVVCHKHHISPERYYEFSKSCPYYFYYYCV